MLKYLTLIEKLSHFQFKVKHVRSQENKMADFMLKNRSTRVWDYRKWTWLVEIQNKSGISNFCF